MGPDIAAGWLIGIPNVLPHSHAVEALLVDWRPSLLDHRPCPICDYLSHPNARMPYCAGPPVLVMKGDGAADDKPPQDLTPLSGVQGWGWARQARVTGSGAAARPVPAWV